MVAAEGPPEARAELRIIADVGDELRFLWNGELRVSRLFRLGEGAQLLDASEAKGKELEPRGWSAAEDNG